MGFREYLADNTPNAEWFAKKGILLQLRNRCETLVWRSLARKVFILGGFHGDQANQAQRGPPPFLHLYKLQAVVKLLESRQKPAQTQPLGFGLKLQPPDTTRSIDKDFVRDELAQEDHEFDDYFNPETYFEAGGEYVQATGPDTLPDEPLGYEPSVNDAAYDELFSLADLASGSEEGEPFDNIYNFESILASLLTQDLMRGYLTHRNPRFAIPGARIKGILPTGFPNVWQTIYARESQDDHVPGWVRPVPAASPFGGAAGPGPGPGPTTGGGGGRVVNLSGAKPVSALG